MPDPFVWDEENHIARTPSGLFIPTSTQVMECQHLSFDFRKWVEPDLLDRRSKIGKDVHYLADIHNKYGAVDPTWLSLDTAGFLQSWIEFKRLAGFVPQQWSVRLCETVNGLQWTGEFDQFGMIGKYPALLDLKTGSSKSDSWGFQLASYEMLKFRSPRIGRIIRAVAHLNANGSPGKLIEFPETSPVDGVAYADTFMAALHTTHVALRRGYLSEKDFLKAA